MVSGMWSTPSLLLLPDILSTRVVVPDRVLSMGQIELFDRLMMCQNFLMFELLVIHSNTCNNSTVT